MSLRGRAEAANAAAAARTAAFREGAGAPRARAGRERGAEEGKRVRARPRRRAAASPRARPRHPPLHPISPSLVCSLAEEKERLAKRKEKEEKLRQRLAANKEAGVQKNSKFKGVRLRRHVKVRGIKVTCVDGAKSPSARPAWLRGAKGAARERPVAAAAGARSPPRGGRGAAVARRARGVCRRCARSRLCSTFSPPASAASRSHVVCSRFRFRFALHAAMLRASRRSASCWRPRRP